MADKITSGFPYPLGGGKMLGIIEHQGPSSYTQVSTGATPSGGDQIRAQMFGLKYLDIVWVMGLDSTGVYEAETVDLHSLDHTYVILRWFTAQGSTELGPASGALANVYVKVAAIGH